MRTQNIKLLKELMMIPSPSGFEGNLAKYVHQELLKVLPKTRVTVDSENNVTARIPGTTDKTVMIDAHIDEIGFIVSNVDNKGTISLQYIGGGCNSILSARELIILSEKGDINAVVDRLHAHLVGDESDEMIENISEAQVDIGIRKRSEILKYIKVGDPVVYKATFNKLMKNYYSGYGFDDKAGCFMLIEIIKSIVKSKKKPQANLVFTFSAQEELGDGRIKPLVKQYKPDVFLNLDVTFATDYLDDTIEKRVGKCDLEKGLVLYRGVNIDPDCLKLMENVAKNNKIKIQYQASTGLGGVNADSVYSLGYKSKILNLGIPLRSMHSPVEIINMNDLASGIKLINGFLLSPRLKGIIEK